MNHDTVKIKGLSIPGRIAPYLVFALMLAASIGVWRFWADSEAARAEAYFDEYCERISQDIAGRIDTYRRVLDGGAGMFIATEKVTREEWRTFVEYHKVRATLPGIQAFGFAKVIAPSELARHVESIRAEGFPEYTVWPEGERAIYTPVVFVAPFSKINREALGFDVSSEPVRRAAIERARDTAAAAMSDRNRLVVGDADEDAQSGFLLYAPVFTSGMPPSGAEARRDSVTGYVFAALHAKDLMRGIFAEAPRTVAFELYDGATMEPEALLFNSRELDGGSGNGHQARFSNHTPLELYGHTWSLVFHSTPQFEAKQVFLLSWIILAAGLAVSTLVFLLMRSQKTITVKARALAADLTVDLRESEQHLNHLNTVSPAVIYTLDPIDCSPTWVSPNVTVLTGYEMEEVLQPGWWAGHLHPQDREEAIARASGVDDAGQTVHEYRFQRKDGELVWIIDELRLQRDDQGNPVEIVGSWMDITERKQAEESNTRLAAAIEQSAETIMIADAEKRIVYVNPAFETTSGYTREEILGQNPRILQSGKHDAAFYRRMWSLLSAGETWHGHMINKRKDGTLYEEDATISPVRNAAGQIINYVAAKRDVTHQAQLEDQLRQAQKMESVGRLAGGVAHDFNNLLMGIMSYTELCLDKIAPDHPIREYLDGIISGAQRSAEITRQLLAFARKQVITPKILDLNDTVAGMLKLLQRLIGEDIKVIWRPGANLRPVKLDPSQIDQILANLFVNARDAIVGVGEITLETGSTTVDAEFSARHPDTIPGAYVFLAVSDDGCGMDKETQAQIFEPFFTTKGVGKGTGLGLATVYGIVKQNNGFIFAYSEPGKGTTFKIYLPQAASMPEATSTADKKEAPRGRGETILLAEDDKSLLVTCGLILKALGYNVLAAETPAQALKLADQHPGDIHLLLTDLVMPGMDGRQLAERISVNNPEIKVLFMSGYTADVIARRGVLDEGVQFLSKPFTRYDLACKLRELLGAD